MFKPILLGVVASLIFLACSPSSDKDTSAPVQEQGNGTCVSESKLMNGIIGGKRVEPIDKDSKTVAMILSTVGKDSGICTAALIRANVLLTAAHCIQATVNKTIVVFHASISCESGFDVRSHAQRVVKTIVHEGYSPSAGTKEGADDIALVFLETSAPAGYPIYKIADPAAVDNSRLYFYGYGVTGSAEKGSGILRKASFAKEDFLIEKDVKKIRVTQDKGVGICYGDSGGPGLVNVNGESQILGVNSFVRGSEADTCNGTSTLALASAYREWINNKINQ